MKRLPVRVAKIGGSLFSLQDVAARVVHWLESSPPMNTVFIVGGGPPVNELRRQKSVGDEAIDEEAAHWLAIQLMNRNTNRVGSRLFPQWPILDDLSEWLAGQVKPCCAEATDGVGGGEKPGKSGARYCLFQPLAWLRGERSLPDELPRDWTVSSDSIAAHLAVRIEAAELVLLKSCGQMNRSVGQDEKGSFAQRGWVDEHFPDVPLGRIETRWINLREYPAG